MIKSSILKIIFLEIIYVLIGYILFGLYPGSYFMRLSPRVFDFYESHGYLLQVQALISFFILYFLNDIYSKKFAKLGLGETAPRWIRRTNIAIAIFVALPLIIWNY